MQQALASGQWDVIICDYTLPHFSAMEAIRVLNESGMDAPLILISGTVGEDLGIAMLQAGASDFLVKGRSGTPGPRNFARHRKQNAGPPIA